MLLVTFIINNPYSLTLTHESKKQGRRTHYMSEISENPHTCVCLTKDLSSAPKSECWTQVLHPKVIVLKLLCLLCDFEYLDCQMI